MWKKFRWAVYGIILIFILILAQGLAINYIKDRALVNTVFDFGRTNVIVMCTLLCFRDYLKHDKL